MMQTKTQKVLAMIALVALSMVNLGGNAFATQIGTGSVTGSGAFDAIINWDDSFPGSASGSVSDIVIKARVLPTLNMEISATEIDLGDLTAGIASSGSVFLEIGTNAVSGVVITARSQSGGLTNTADNSVQINDEATDGVVESYTWASTPNATDDAADAAFAATGLATTQIDDIIDENVIYDTNKPEATLGLDDVEFIVTAQSEIDTPAGLYEDRVTFTVTGTF